MSRVKITSQSTLGDPKAVDTLLSLVRETSHCRKVTVADTSPEPSEHAAKVDTVEIHRTPPVIRALYDEGIIGVLGGRR